jgi:hypothetical protein
MGLTVSFEDLEEDLEVDLEADPVSIITRTLPTVLQTRAEMGDQPLEHPLRMEVGDQPLELHPLLELPLPTGVEYPPQTEMVDRPTLEGMRYGGRDRREDLADFSGMALLVPCASSLGRWEDK